MKKQENIAIYLLIFIIQLTVPIKSYKYMTGTLSKNRS